MPKIATKTPTVEAKKVEKFSKLSRWCSRCIATSPREITQQGYPDEIDSKFWKDHSIIESVCGSCGNSTKDFFTDSEISNMKSVGILR